MNDRILKAIKSVRTNVPVVLFFGALVLGASACGLGNKGSDTSSANASGGDQAASAPQADAPTAPAASAAGLDVLSMNACTMFPGEAVAQALNATLSDPSNTGKGSGGPDCTYGLLTNGGSGGTQLYFINLVDPKLFDLSLKALVDPKPIDGLGGDAFSGTRIGTSTYEIMARNAGGVSIDVLGSDADLVRKLAEYVLANL
jgi:hypothetical protein